MGERNANLAPDQRVGQVLRLATDLEGRDASQIDRPYLMAKDDRVLGLPGVAAWKRNFTWITRRSGGYRADRGHAGSMKGLIRNDKNSPTAALFMTNRGVQLGNDDGPPKWSRPRRSYSGHDSASPKSRAKSVISWRNSGSAAAAAHRSPSACSRCS